MIQLSPAQDTVVQDASAWIRAAAGYHVAFQAPWKYLAGYAGTGKTTLAKKLAEEFKVAYCAFTGKAAQVLRDKGCEGATTLHKLIYRPSEKVVKALDGTDVWSTEFTARDDAPLDEYDVIVLDECSMADTRMAQDLLSYGKPVLVLGDPFQLPPVQGEGYFTSKQPDWTLTEVHRQARDSGILRLATDVREGRGVLDPASYGPEAVVCSMDEASANEQDLLGWCDVVLVGTHRMRHHFNNQYRAAALRRGPYPEAGEQLVCLQNDHERGLLNGSIWRVEHDAREDGHLKLQVLVREHGVSGGTLLLADTWAHDFLGIEGEFVKMPWQRRAQRARFAYGYALTVHKAQGSEYDRVLLVDESNTFREQSARWLYTAITRAAKQLVVVRR